MIPIKIRLSAAVQVATKIIQPEYTLTEILDALEELRDEVDRIVEAMKDDVEREGEVIRSR